MEQPFQEESSQEEPTTSPESNKGSPTVNVASKNWKAWLAFWKVAPMPQKGWKKEFNQFPIQTMEKKQPQKKIKTVESDEPEEKPKVRKELKRTPLKRSAVPLRKTPLAPIGKKKKERLKNEWSEVDVFQERWLTGDQCCEICLLQGKKPEDAKVKNAFMNGKLIKPQCFPHRLAKWLFPQFRLLLENIWLVCWIGHHTEFDLLHLEPAVRNALEEKFNLIIQQKSCDQ